MLPQSGCGRPDREGRCIELVSTGDQRDFTFSWLSAYSHVVRCADLGKRRLNDIVISHALSRRIFYTRARQFRGFV